MSLLSCARCRNWGSNRRIRKGTGEGDDVKRAMPITALFLDIGGVLFTNEWDQQARERAAETFDLDLDEMEDCHDLIVGTHDMGKLTLEQCLSRAVFYQKRPFARSRFRARAPNQVWSLDFVADLLAEGWRGLRSGGGRFEHRPPEMVGRYRRALYRRPSSASGPAGEEDRLHGLYPGRQRDCRAGVQSPGCTSSERDLCAHWHLGW